MAYGDMSKEEQDNFFVIHRDICNPCGRSLNLECIACGEITDHPCFQLNTKDLSKLRRKGWRDISGSARASGHNPDKKSDKDKLIDGLLHSMKAYKLNTAQKDNLRNELKRLRLELLIAITGSMITTQEGKRPMDVGVFEYNSTEIMWKYIALNYDPKYADYGKPPIAELARLNENDLIIERGLDEYLPPRDRNYIKHGTIPKYKEKIDIESYVDWWKAVNWVYHYLPNAFIGIREKVEERYGTEFLNSEQGDYVRETYFHREIQSNMPTPCEKAGWWHKHQDGGFNRRVITNLWDTNIKINELECENLLNVNSTN